MPSRNCKFCSLLSCVSVCHWLQCIVDLIVGRFYSCYLEHRKKSTRSKSAFSTWPKANSLLKTGYTYCSSKLRKNPHPSFLWPWHSCWTPFCHTISDSFCVRSVLKTGISDFPVLRNIAKAVPIFLQCISLTSVQGIRYLMVSVLVIRCSHQLISISSALIRYGNLQLFLHTMVRRWCPLVHYLLAVTHQTVLKKYVMRRASSLLIDTRTYVHLILLSVFFFLRKYDTHNINYP